VPVICLGEASGVKNSGGVLEQILRSLEVECLPKDLPESIIVEVSKLEIGDAIHIKDIQLPAGVIARGSPDASVVHCVAPAVEEVAPAPGTEGAAPTEPEVIKEKKPEAGETPAAEKGDKGDKAAKPEKK
jgi:large subunit ribosomal protein L25